MVYYGWKTIAAVIPVTLFFAGCASWPEFVAVLSRPDSELKSSVTALGFVESVYVFFVFVPSPFAKMVWQVLGIKSTFLTGVAISLLGLAISSIAPSVTFLTLSRGMLVGFGACLALTPITFLLADWFPWEHRFHVLATSVRYLVNPLGSVVFVNIFRWINDSFGWRYNFLFLITYGSCTCGILVPILRHPKPCESQNTKPKKTQCSDASWSVMSKTVIVVLWMWISFGKALGLTAFYTIMVKYGEDMGYDSLTATHPLTAEGITACLSRAITSFFGDHIKGYFLHMYVVCTALLSLAHLLLPFAKVPVAVIMFGAVVGAGQGPIVAGWYAACNEVLGGESVHTFFILLLVSWGLGRTTGSLLPGLIVDFHQEYSLLFFILGTSYGSMAVSLLVIIELNRRHMSNQKSSNFFTQPEKRVSPPDKCTLDKNKHLSEVESVLMQTKHDQSNLERKPLAVSTPHIHYTYEEIQPKRN
ncbi:uncharacterized protein LOC106160379 isoform X1 [Lingula anatina]|uniref:Uncharacterized protein LOC106160379 isoform X1 n=2 Tax=Lingula anatina TaxID=7574 RepID=A0A1S3I2E6_LINAN|nr:uncharacterized protein LOC106160379 isoform X1 [Lingula anatina]XP_023932748.1 uncharacterized protein LOC106160379 isoform X1 [Lingula anatina]|eukprot:XP_013392418.2 uncharacterized protein LOC106160379 isoform X1 [Lingula anatina]